MILLRRQLCGFGLDGQGGESRTQHNQHGGHNPEVGTSGCNGDAELDLDKVRDNGRHQGNDPKTVVVCLHSPLLGEKRRHYERDEQVGCHAQQCAERQRRAKVGWCPGEHSGRLQDTSAYPECQECYLLPPLADEPQPLETKVEYTGEEEQVDSHTKPSAGHQGIQCLIMRPVGRGVTLLKVGEFGGIEAVVSNVHGLRSVANYRPQRVKAVRLSFLTGSLKGLVPAHEIKCSLPDQDTHPASAFFGLKHLAQPADVAHVSQGVHQGRCSDVEHDKENERADCGDYRQPGHPDPSPDQSPDSKEDKHTTQETE